VADNSLDATRAVDNPIITIKIDPEVRGGKKATANNE
jgi:hypothetical protein